MACEGGNHDWATATSAASVPGAFVPLLSREDRYASGRRLGDYLRCVASPGRSRQPDCLGTP